MRVSRHQDIQTNLFSMEYPSLTVIILTMNSEASIGAVIKSCQGLGKRILVVDSGSSDDTVAIANELGCEVVSHPFEHYSAQRNWAQDHAQLGPQDWVLHLDSDEELSAELHASITSALKSPLDGIDGYLMRRLTHFWGKPIRYGHMNPSWHLRLFRAGKGKCEDRLYDQHFVCSGKTAKLKGVLLDMQSVDLERWTATHNRWSTLEAAEILSNLDPSGDVLQENLLGDLRQRKRWIKNRLWYRSPKFLRVYLFFIYSYFLKLGFLDGRVGFVYHTLQVFWFRFLIDAKIEENFRIPAAEPARSTNLAGPSSS